jgi:hypothetical protein
LSAEAGNAPEAALELVWLIKALQENTQTGQGPDVKTYLGGFSPATNEPLGLVFSNATQIWTGYSPAQRTALVQAYLGVWFDQVQKFTVSQYYNSDRGDGLPYASPTEDPSNEDPSVWFGGPVWYMLPAMRHLGVDATLTYRVSAWAATLWPAANWALNDTL